MSVKKRRLMTIAAVVFVAAVLAIVLWLGEREPEYQGKKLSEWLKVYTWHLGKIDCPEVAEANAAVTHMGTNALPFLQKWIAYEPGWREKIVDAIPLKFRNSLEPLVRQRQMEYNFGRSGFYILGPQAAPATRPLCRMICETNKFTSHYAALDAMLGMGDKGLSLVAEDLHNSDREVRTTATNAMRLIVQHRSAPGGRVKQEGR